MTSRWARIAGLGSALPDRVVTNDDLTAMGVDTSDEWIRTRTGIGARRFAAEGDSTSSLGAEAARRALDAAGLDPGSVDLTICATFTGDQPLPSTASFIQERLGVTGAAFDLAAACAGFIYAAEVGAAQIQTGSAETVLIVGTEVMSGYLDMEDRTTCVLFGDGAGAAILVPGEDPGIVGSVLENDGRHARILQVPEGGSSPPSGPAAGLGGRFIRMQDGREVFKRAVRGMADAAGRLLEKEGLALDDVDLLVPHQANARIIRAVADRLSFPADRVYVDLERVGNTSAASVPIALDHAWREGRLRAGSLVLTAAFGAGLSWGANLIRWTAEPPRGDA